MIEAIKKKLELTYSIVAAVVVVAVVYGFDHTHVLYHKIKAFVRKFLPRKK